jgi:hypothetical protein
MAGAQSSTVSRSLLVGRVIVVSALGLVLSAAHSEKAIGFALLKTKIKFPVAQVDRHVFNEMFCAYSVLEKGFAHQVPAEQYVLQMEFGYKRGGIVTVYETPAYGTKGTAQFFKDLVASRKFKDHFGKPGFASEVVPNHKVFTVACSFSKPILAEAVAELKTGRF